MTTNQVIPVFHGTYSSEEYSQWKSGDLGVRRRFPAEPIEGEQRFMYSANNTGHFYFEAVATRHLVLHGYDAWHESTKLVDPTKKWNSNSEIVSELVGTDRLAALAAEFADVRFSDPDVIGYHPQLGRAVFLEVKQDDFKANGERREKEPLQGTQEASLLALMKHFPNAIVGILRLAPGDAELIEIPGLTKRGNPETGNQDS